MKVTKQKGKAFRRGKLYRLKMKKGESSSRESLRTLAEFLWGELNWKRYLGVYFGEGEPWPP